MINDLLSRLKNVKPAGEGKWMSSCPHHDDSTPSLSVRVVNNGKILLNCFGGCTADQICGSIGYELKDLFTEEDVMPDPRIIGKKMSLRMMADKTGLPKSTLIKMGWTEVKGEVRVPYYDFGGTELYAKRRDGSKKKYYFEVPGTKQIAYGLWKLSKFRENGKAVIVEGETDTATLWHFGIPAIGIPGSTALKTITPGMFNGFTELWVVRENNDAGYKFSEDVPLRLRDTGYKGSISVVPLPPEVTDTNDLYRRQAPEKFKPMFREMLRRSRSHEDRINDYLEDWTDLVEEDIDFLWPTYVPKGFVTLLAGKGGRGKSFISCALATALTTGTSVLPGEDEMPHGKVLFCGTEDDPRYKGGIRTRLRTMGADLNYVRSLKLDRFMTEKGEMFSLNSEGVTFLRKILDVWPAKLVVVDPVIRFMGSNGESINNNKQVRSVMDNLAMLAKEKGIAILCVAHFRKGGAENAVDSIMGAADFVNAARSVLLVYPNPRARPTQEEQEENSFYGAVTHDKVNLFARSPTQSYRIWSQEDGSPGFQWTGQLDLGPEDLAAKCGRSAADLRKLQLLRSAILTYIDTEGEVELKQLRGDMASEQGATPPMFFDALGELEEERLLDRQVIPSIGGERRQVSIRRFYHAGEEEEVL